MILGCDHTPQQVSGLGFAWSIPTEIMYRITLIENHPITMKKSWRSSTLLRCRNSMVPLTILDASPGSSTVSVGFPMGYLSPLSSSRCPSTSRIRSNLHLSDEPEALLDKASKNADPDRGRPLEALSDRLGIVYYLPVLLLFLDDAVHQQLLGLLRPPLRRGEMDMRLRGQRQQVRYRILQKLVATVALEGRTTSTTDHLDS